MPPTQEPNQKESEIIIQNMLKTWNSLIKRVLQDEMLRSGRFSTLRSKLGLWLANRATIFWLIENLLQKIYQTSRPWDRCQFCRNRIATVVANIATKHVVRAFRGAIWYWFGAISKIYWNDKRCWPWTTSSRKSEFNLESLTLSWSIYWSQKWAQRWNQLKPGIHGLFHGPIDDIRFYILKRINGPIIPEKLFAVG